MLIAVDDPSSWPAGLLATLLDGLPNLRGYQAHRSRMDRAREENPNDIMLRVNPAPNPYRVGREAMVENIERQLFGLSLVGWHCTRLCLDEVNAVRSAGMCLLSPETLAGRLQRRLEAGDITMAVADRLRAKNRAHEENRRGQLWFVLTRNLLATSGVDDLLGLWGGEALYTSHCRDPVVGPILSTLGTSCIVELAVPVASIRSYGGLGITIVRVFELANGLKDENPADCEGYTLHPIRGDQVLRVITAEDPAFAEMRVGQE